MPVTRNKPVQVTIGPEDLKEIARLTSRLGLTRSQLLRHSFELYKLLVDYRSDGWEILVRRGDETVRLARI